MFYTGNSHHACLNIQAHIMLAPDFCKVIYILHMFCPLHKLLSRVTFKLAPHSEGTGTHWESAYTRGPLRMVCFIFFHCATLPSPHWKWHGLKEWYKDQFKDVRKDNNDSYTYGTGSLGVTDLCGLIVDWKGGLKVNSEACTFPVHLKNPNGPYH